MNTGLVSQDNAEAKVKQALTKLVAYVESIAGRAARSTPTVPSVPQSVRADTSDHEGEIELFGKPVPNVRSYRIESSIDPPQGTAKAFT